jgi:hypothetical protein
VRAVIVELHPKVYGQDGMAECLARLEAAGLRRDETVSQPTVVTCLRPAPAAG